MKGLIVTVVTVGTALALSGHLLSQPMLSGAAGTAVESRLATVSAVNAASPTPPKASLTGRWLDLTTFSHTERYRNGFASGSYHDFDNAQARSLIQGKLKLDAPGRYSVGFRASSGRYFNWAYGGYTGTSFVTRVGSPANTATYFVPRSEAAELVDAIFADPAGWDVVANHLNSNGWQFYLRELYVSATPVERMTVEFGSFGIERGLSTEITTFDEDGYLSGERVRLHDSKHLFFDEVSFTNAFFGDYDKPNLFVRGSSLKHANYRQVAGRKIVNRRLSFSGEYTRQSGTDTLREAVKVGISETRVLDAVRVETYQRLHAITFAGASNSPIGPIAPLRVNGASGFAVVLEKKWNRMNGDVGFASIDREYAVYADSRGFEAVAFSFNGDTYGVGKRPFLHASFRVAPGVTAFGFYTHAVGKLVTNVNQQGLNAGVNFDLKAMVNARKAVF